MSLYENLYVLLMKIDDGHEQHGQRSRDCSRASALCRYTLYILSLVLRVAIYFAFAILTR